MSERAYGVWAGLSVDNTAEATAAGALYSDNAGKIAVLTKTTRNAMIGFVVLGAALFFAARAGRQFQGSKARFIWKMFPKFVLGFLLFSTLASLAFFSKPTAREYCKSQPLGISADLCRRRPTDQLP